MRHFARYEAMRIFLSYASPDREAACAIEPGLREQGSEDIGFRSARDAE